MLRVILLILLLFTGCSDRDRSTSDDVNQEQTEQTTTETANEVEGSVDHDKERGLENQLPHSEDGFISSMLKFILLGAIILLIIASIMGIFLKRRMYESTISDLETRVDYYKDKCVDKNDLLKNARDKIDSLNQNLSWVKKQKKELEESLSELRSSAGNADSDKLTKGGFKVEELGIRKESFSETVEEPKVKTSLTEKYFTVPNPQGKFKHENGISTCEGKRMYKLTYQHGETVGKIEFISSQYDEIAINLKDSMIKPACNITKENENNPSSVSQIGPGKVKRVGDEWIIESKIKVEIS